MGIDTMGPPAELVEGLRARFSFDCFVETGTFHGDTTMWASKLFNRVVTIEASKPLFERAQKRFSSVGNVESYFGNSPSNLAKLAPDLPPSIYFLDAHWCDGETAGSSAECPLLSELAVLLPWFQNSIWLIDDARLFVEPPPYPHKIDHWPSLDQIVQCTMGQAYMAVYRDVIILAPQHSKQPIADLLRSLKSSRLQA